MLLRDFDEGRRVGLARVISAVENQRPGFREVLGALHGRLGNAHRIGITGPPGAGKSTLTTSLVSQLRARGERIGIVAVDPTSPFTGGALLGDRIRMGDIALDDGVFIRSMATRGSHGGLALTTKEVADVMDAFGFDRVIVETVGVGQSELDVASAADTTVVLLVPESGDSIQAMKAGLMEAADLFVVNKADRPGADRVAREIGMMLHLRLGQGVAGLSARKRREPSPAAWEVPVLQTIAENGAGVPELVESLDRHRAWLTDSGELERRRNGRLSERVREEVGRELRSLAWDGAGAEILNEQLPALGRGDVTPYEVAAMIVRAVAGAAAAK
jgi:LAO/AO transport system kinase